MGAPLALWPQALSVLVFGYHGWALLLPRCSKASRRSSCCTARSGENVALLAAVILALTPVTVMINRGNDPDTSLVLFLVAAYGDRAARRRAGGARVAARGLTAPTKVRRRTGYFAVFHPPRTTCLDFGNGLVQ